MKISRLHIENFRSIQGPLDLDLSQVNALVGPNNTGKTNILLALQKFLGYRWLSVNMFDENDVYLRDPDRDIRIELDLDPPFEYQSIKGADSVKIRTLVLNYTRYKIGVPKGQRRLDKGCLDPDGKTPMVLAKAPRKGEQHKYQPLVGIPQEILDVLPIIFIGMKRELKDQLPNARYSMLRQLLEDVDADFRNPENVSTIVNDKGIETNEPRSQQFERLMGQAMSLLRTKEFEQLEQSIKKNALRQLGLDPVKDTDKLDFFFSPFSSMDFYKSLKLFVREGEFSIDATELGGGVQNSLVMAILRAFEERRKKGAIFLIEEPEMYLHPQMQRSLYKTFREISRTNQIIYTTHSPHFVTIPEYSEVILITKNDEGTQKQVSNLAIDEVRREKIRKEMDPERNELFFAKKLILVEGDTEKLSLPEYAKKMHLDLDTEGTTVVEVGGKRSLLEFARIAISFNIPTAIVYDEDSSDFSKEDKEQGNEAQYNEELDQFENGNSSVSVWKLSNKYEDELRRALSEEGYQELCQKYPGHSKAIRQRLIAADPDSGVPEFIKNIIDWGVQS
ncbi:AAA family ATPase [Acidobacteria bacterium AH-259-G07]|nr:AAA family ATPase [Acidobacteria bacterium AH-259-G07]